QLGDFAVQIRAKMMTLPGEQFVIRRQAYAMIKKAFDENGIKFAFPTVQVAGDGEPATTAVAQHALELVKPAPATACQGRDTGADGLPFCSSSRRSPDAPKGLQAKPEPQIPPIRRRTPGSGPSAAEGMVVAVAAGCSWRGGGRSSAPSASGR